MRYFLFPVSRIKSLCYTEAFIAPASSEAGATGGRSPIPIPNTLLETPWTNYVPRTRFLDTSHAGLWQALFFAEITMEPLSGASLLDLAGAVDEPNPSFENTVEESF